MAVVLQYKVLPVRDVFPSVGNGSVNRISLRMSFDKHSSVSQYCRQRIFSKQIDTTHVLREEMVSV